MIEAYSLYSGSSGNSYLIHHNDTLILVDAGRSCAALCRAVRAAGFEPENVSAVFITHEHSDHVSALRVFNKKYRVPIIGLTPVLYEVCENEEMCGCAKALVEGREFFVGEIGVCGCMTPHDSSANVCYRFRTRSGSSLVIATDMGEVTKECSAFLAGADCAVIESNHDPVMLRDGIYPQHLKARIASKFGHLSNPQCGDLAVSLANSGTAGFVLAHLSRENNTPELAHDTVCKSLADAGFGDIPVVCAGEDYFVRATVEKGHCEICSLREDT